MEKEVIELLIKAGEIFVLCLSILVVVWFMSRDRGQSNKAVVALAEAQKELAEAQRGNTEVSRELASSQRKLSEAWERSLDVLQKMQVATMENITDLKAHDGRVAAMRASLDGAVSAMNATVAQRDSQINEIPGKVKEIMSDDIQDLKDKNQAIIDEIKALRSSIDQRIDSLRGVLPSQIDPLRSDIAALTQKVDVLLNAKQVPPEPPADVKPIEDTPHAQS